MLRKDSRASQSRCWKDCLGGVTESVARGLCCAACGSRTSSSLHPQPVSPEEGAPKSELNFFSQVWWDHLWKLCCSSHSYERLQCSNPIEELFIKSCGCIQLNPSETMMVVVIVIRKTKPFMSQCKDIESDCLFFIMSFFPSWSWYLVLRMFVVELDKVRSLYISYP